MKLALGCTALIVLVVLGLGIAYADYVVNASQPVVISDDLTNRVTVVISAP
jgi:hypothetical protein